MCKAKSFQQTAFIFVFACNTKTFAIVFIVFFLLFLVAVFSNGLAKREKENEKERERERFQVDQN